MRSAGLRINKRLLEINIVDVLKELKLAKMRILAPLTFILK